MLRAAWDAAPASASSLLTQIQAMLGEAQEQLAEDLDSSASNSHSSHSNIPGTNRLTDQETVRGWNQIITAFKTVRLYLINCANYGLDAFAVQMKGSFPMPPPAAVNPPVLIDDGFNQWQQLCVFESIDPATVIGQAVDDEAIYLWLVNNASLLEASKNRTESRGNYSAAIVGRTGGGF